MPPAQLYPEPTVGALIFDPAGRLFLMRSHKWGGRYVVPGGHVELGETLEAALRRAVAEETGLTIHDIRFVCTQESVKSPTHPRAILGLVVLALLLAACTAQPAAVTLPPETAIPTVIPPTLTASPTASSTPAATPSPTASATLTPEPTCTPTPTPTSSITSTATPRPDAGWEKLPGPSLLLPALWNVNYGKDNIAVANGVLTTKAAKGDWFTYENPQTMIQVKADFAVDLKLAGTGHYGVLLYGRSASGGEWWQGLRRFDIGFDGDKYPVIECRDGASSAGQRWSLKRLDPEGMTLLFSPQGAAFDVQDSVGNTLLRAPAPVTLARPLFPDNLMWLGTNADGGVKGGSSLTVTRLEVRSAKGEAAWKETPADAAVVRPQAAKPQASSGRQEIVLQPGRPNEVALYPDFIFQPGAMETWRINVRAYLGSPPISEGPWNEGASRLIIGPRIQSAWIEDGRVFISFSFTHDGVADSVIGRFIVSPYLQSVIAENPFSAGRIHGRRPEDIPPGAKLAIWIPPEEQLSGNSTADIIGVGY